MMFDFGALDPGVVGKLLTATIVPRPIAWVVSQDGSGQSNAAPFSFFNVFSVQPPVVCIGVHHEPGVVKDTGANIELTGEFVVNLVPESLAQSMNLTAAEFPAGVDELAFAKLATVPSAAVKPPRIAESPVALECRLMQLIKLNASQWIVIGQVLVLHVADEAVIAPDQGHIDTPRLGLVARMHGGGWYAKTTDLFNMPRVGVPAGAMAPDKEISSGL